MSAIDVLREVEWAGGGEVAMCPRCRADRDPGRRHFPGCALAAALRETDPVAAAYEDAARFVEGMRDVYEAPEIAARIRARARSTP